MDRASIYSSTVIVVIADLTNVRSDSLCVLLEKDKALICVFVCFREAPPPSMSLYPHLGSGSRVR